MATVNGLNLLSGVVSHPLTGRWHADVRLAPKQGDAPAALSGAVSMDLDGVQFAGTVVRSGSEDGSIGARLVGGKGGMDRVLPEKWHKGTPTVGRIVNDIMRETGEVLASISNQTLLTRPLAAWQREQGPAGPSLSLLLETLGGSWRMLPNGQVLVVWEESWPTVNPEHVLIEEHPAPGYFLVAPTGAPDLVPGVTFRGKRIRYVEHEIDSGKLRTRARYEQPRAMLDRLRKMDTSAMYSRMWPAVVERQNADKTIDVVVAGRFGLTQVPLRHGLPGFVVEVAAGARVLIGFEADDPRVPFAALWPNGESVQSISFDGGTRAFARVGDPVQVFMTPAVPIVISGVLGIPPATTPFTGTITITNPLLGIIQDGNPKFLG